MTPGLDQQYGDATIDSLPNLQMASHLYGVAKAQENEKIEEQLETVYDKLQDYRRAKMPGSREDKIEVGTELWAEASKYWDMTGQYDSKALSAITPIFAVYSEGIGVGMQDADDMEELKELLDGGIEGF